MRVRIRSERACVRMEGDRRGSGEERGWWLGWGAGHLRLRVSRAAREGSAAASAAPPSGPMLFSLRRNGGRGGGSRSARSAADGAEVMIAAVNALVCVWGFDQCGGCPLCADRRSTEKHRGGRRRPWRGLARWSRRLADPFCYTPAPPPPARCTTQPRWLIVLSLVCCIYYAHTNTHRHTHRHCNTQTHTQTHTRPCSFLRPVSGQPNPSKRRCRLTSTDHGYR